MRKSFAFVVVALAALALALPAHAATPSVSFDPGMDGSIVRSTPVVPTVCAPDPTTVDPGTIDPKDPVGSAQNALGSMSSLCQSSPVQVDGHVDGTATSDVAITRIRLIFAQEKCVTDPNGDEHCVTGPTSADVDATPDCTDLTATSCTFVQDVSFPLVPGPYDVTAEVTDKDGAQATAHISVTIV